KIPRTFRPRRKPICSRSTIRGIVGVARLGIAGILVLAEAEAVEQPGDFGATAGAVVANEDELRRSAKPKRLADSAPEKPVRLLEARERVVRARVRLEGHEIHLRDAEIAAHLDIAHGDAIEPRVLDFRAEQLVQQLLKLRSDSASSRILNHLQRSCDLCPFVALDLIADLDVVVVAHADTALGPGTHLGDVVLE